MDMWVDVDGGLWMHGFGLGSVFEDSVDADLRLSSFIFPFHSTRATGTIGRRYILL